MTCTACIAAESDPQTGRYNANCDACSVRAVAQSPQFFHRRDGEKEADTYRAMLTALFGKDLKEWHERVKAWRAQNADQA